MAKEVKVKAPHDSWQWLMFLSNSFLMPEKLSGKTYGVVERVRVQDEISAIFDCLRPYSHYAQQHGGAFKALFGPKDSWVAQDPKEMVPELKASNPSVEHEVRLTEKAVSGMIWLFSVILTPPAMVERNVGGQVKQEPEHPYFMSPSLAARFIWPMAKAVKKEGALRKAVGIDVVPAMVWADDPAEEVAK
jgi:hypothetical protein